MRKKMDALEIQAAAYIYSQHGSGSQADIGRILGLSQAVVSRALKQAKLKGWLKDSPQFVKNGISEERMAEILARAAPNKLCDKLKALSSKFAPPEVRVFPTVGFAELKWSTNQNEIHRRIEAFGLAAGGYAAEIVAQSRGYTGISWGNTLAMTVAGMKRGVVDSPRRQNPITFFPVSGEPLGSSLTSLSASTLAVKLDEIFNGGTKHCLSLAAVPALIPKAFTDGPNRKKCCVNELAVIRKLIGQVDSYREIFGEVARQRSNRLGLIENMDCLITGIGHAEKTLAWEKDELVKKAGFDRTHIKNLVIGDISGVLIPKPGLADHQKYHLKEIMDRWTGLAEEHIENCAKKAREESTPGIVVVAAGANKAKILHEVYIRGWMSHALIDQTLSNAWLKIVEDHVDQKQ
jgi:DNA-binding transcriptional regulator LsrR (DeoR family)